MAKIAKEQGSTAMAITDHGVMYGAIEFYKAARDEGIKGIIGCEMYVAPLGRLRKEPGTPINHLILLAYNNTGYQNLMNLVSKANLEGFYYKPRVDHGLLREFSEGLICLSGCLASEVSRAILDNNEAKARETIKLYQDIFGPENYYLEVQDHPEIADQVILNQAIFRIGKEMNVPVVATADSHYARKEDHHEHDVLICIQTGKTLEDTDRMKFEGEFHIRTPQEMAEAFKDHPEALENTVKIAERCDVQITFGKNLLPTFKTPDDIPVQQYLRILCEEGLIKRYGDSLNDEHKKRMEYELETIHNSGFDAYFLIVHDFVKYAKDSGVIVGPGRGSAAGSLVAYILNITDVDPMLYGLLFERFLNPERVSMPDIDIDFDDAHRGDVLNYVVDKYGRSNVAQIITFGTMAARAAVRDVGRAMGYPYAEVDKISKMIPPPLQGKHIPLAKSVVEDHTLKAEYDSNLRAKTLLDTAIKLEGTVRHAGTHACAVVISGQPLNLHTPLQRGTGDDDSVISQYSMKPIEELGLLKMDFLGLKNLTIIHNTLNSIERMTQQKIDISLLPLNDEKTFHLLSIGDTTGVFQLESGGMRRYLKELKPTTIHDIIAMVSLYRPGPMAYIPVYIKGKHDPSTVEYLDPSFETILKETNGVAVYQEQVLQLARSFAGFSLGEADILRKAVGKKDPKLLANEKDKFISGAVAQGHKKKFAEDVFEKVIKPFAAYGFNKSHATCYAMIAYRTAYLKANFPAHFMASLLTSDASDEERVSAEVMECETMGIHVLPPHINESMLQFAVVNDATIRFGLSAIKGVGEEPIKKIIEAREKAGPFTSLEDFCKRVPSQILNKKLLEALAYSGALECFGDRRTLAESCEEISRYAKDAQLIREDGQIDIFGAMEGAIGEVQAPLILKNAKKATRLEKLQWEKQYLGLYVSGHPMQGLRAYLGQKVSLLSTLTPKHVSKLGRMCGLLTKVKRVVTKAGASMAYCQLEDMTGRIEMTIFPRTFNECSASIKEGLFVKVEGKFEERNGELHCMVQKIKDVSLEAMIKNAKEEGRFDETEKMTPMVTSIKINKQEATAKDTGPFVISMTEKTDEAALSYLKTLLMANRGSREVHLKITPAGGESKIIKVPFGVDVSHDLKIKINEIVK